MTKTMGIDSAARYLDIGQEELARLVKMGEIPYLGSPARPLFPVSELDAWASRRILEKGALTKAAKRGAAGLSASSLISPERVLLSFNPKTRTSVISGLVAHCEELGLLYDPGELFGSLRRREELSSTGMSGGFALLHPFCRDPYLAQESFLVFARSARPVFFGAPDGKPTTFFFLLVCMDEALHLKTLASLCSLLSDASVTGALCEAQSEEEICAILGRQGARR